ncbi:hypothetical protein [Nocardiopsis sp. B62]|uniref:hypothetical protein n=1 Tax=Nocardiopsis sp. B62 TaxID=2824874 RepID=UPI001B35FE8E|nr:hypothetical protein [Nocardiopsis sp. B62]MBQ1083384.1 hypothetical protein [Nocardiopsis sp. B62]
MPEMLTVNEQFDAIVGGVRREVSGDKMDPYREPTPQPKPAEEKDKKGEGQGDKDGK